MDFIDEIMYLFDHYEKSKPSKINLEKYQTTEGFLSMSNYWLYIVTLIENQPFFNRFNRQELQEVLRHAKFKKYKSLDEVVFIDQFVAVIINGSVRAKSHDISIK